MIECIVHINKKERFASEVKDKFNAVKDVVEDVAHAVTTPPWKYVEMGVKALAHKIESKFEQLGDIIEQGWKQSTHWVWERLKDAGDFFKDLAGFAKCMFTFGAMCESNTVSEALFDPSRPVDWYRVLMQHLNKVDKKK